MKCEEAQKYLTALPDSSDWVREIAEAKAHANACRACAEYVRFAERLQRSLDVSIEPSSRLLDAIGKSVVCENPRPRRFAAWVESIGGIPQMKKLAISTATLVVAGAVLFGIMARPAIAAEPKATFKKMKKAVLASKAAGGQGGSWIVIEDKLIPLEPGKPHTFTSGNLEITVGDEKGMMSDEVAKQIEKETGMTIEEILSGDSNVRAFADGQEIHPEIAQQILKAAGTDVKISIDLDEAKYQDIRFGKDQNTLLLTPLAKNGMRYVVQLDSKSSLPRKVTLEKNLAGKWTAVKKSGLEVVSPLKKKI